MDCSCKLDWAVRSLNVTSRPAVLYLWFLQTDSSCLSLVDIDVTSLTLQYSVCWLVLVESQQTLTKKLMLVVLVLVVLMMKQVFSLTWHVVLVLYTPVCLSVCLSVERTNEVYWTLLLLRAERWNKRIECHSIKAQNTKYKIHLCRLLNR